jgi:hypothetical protein
MSKVVIINIPDKPSNEDLFCGYIESKLRYENPLLSRSHSQPKRVHSSLGIAPTIHAGESLGRYWIITELK